RLWIIHEEYARQRRIEDWIEYAKGLRDAYGIQVFRCDPSEPDYIQAFNDAGLNAVQADNSVAPGIQAVRQRLIVRGDNLPRLFIHSSAANLMIEFEQYQWMKHRAEQFFRDMPLKANDHAMD